MTARPFKALCTRSGGWWAISVPDADGLWTQARRLDQAEQMARDAIAAVLELEEDEVEVQLEVACGDPHLDDAVETARRLRSEAESVQREASEQMSHTVHLLRDKTDLSMRDIAVLLGVSHQRVGQLARH